MRVKWRVKLRNYIPSHHVIDISCVISVTLLEARKKKYCT